MKVTNNILELFGETPLVKLNKLTEGYKAKVYAKMESMNPGGSVKDRIGLAMILDAEKRGVLKPGGTIIEATSGNTGIGLAITAAVKGYKSIFTMTEKVSVEKRRYLQAFGADVDYGQAVKFYEAEPIGPGRYSPPKVVRAERHVVAGNPDQKHISTSLVERQNLTMRMSMRRFTRLTNAFSKKAENHRAAVGLHFAHYNFVRQHKTLRISPAMAAGVENRLWTLEELVAQTSN
jgi:hypothetical protein